MRSVGLDIGTTTISAVVVDVESRSVEKAYTISNGSFIKTPMAWQKQQDPAVIISKAMQLLDDICEQYRGICRIGLTGQMHGIVYVDRDGKHISPLYTWQDGSGDVEDFDGESICHIVERECGMKVYTGYGLVTYLYHQKKGELPDGAAGLCTIADYLGMALTGRKDPYMHSGNAASLGFYDVKNHTFMTEMLAGLGADISILPKVTDEYRQLGTYKDIPVITAIGDNQASFLGSVKEPEKSILVNMGTGGQVSVLSDRVCYGRDIETRPFNNGTYLIAGSSLCGGRAYAVLENFFRSYAESMGIEDVDHYHVMDEILKEEGYCKENAICVDTRFSGTRENPLRKGSITGLDVHNFTPASMIYGVLDGMAQELYDMYTGIDDKLLTGKTVMVASGNGIRKNRHLQHIMEEKFGMKLQLAENKEEAAFGAALTDSK